MSTKATIAFGETFHLYTDYREKGYIWLELDQPVKFSADEHAVQVGLPFALWEYLRTFAAAKTDLAAKTDAELRAIARERIATTIERYQADREKVKGRRRQSLALFFHEHDKEVARNPEMAIQELLQHLRKQRTEQRHLLAGVEKLRHYPILAAAQQRRHNRRIEKRHEDLLAGRCKPRGQFEKDFVERHNPTKPRRLAGRGSTSHQR